MSGVNKAILIGNLGADPEVRHLENGATVANFRIATTESYKDRHTGERREQTEWHNIVAWRGLGEVVEKYLRKGSKVYVEGKIRTRQWEDRDGNKRYTTEIQADELTMLDRPSDRPEQQTDASAESKPNAERVPQPMDDEKDDLPF